MLINGARYKIAILVLFMEREFDVTTRCLESLLGGIEDNVTISVLLNGGHSAAFKERYDRRPAVKYYESIKNLGVAGGRNFLLNTEECRQSDIVFVLDNDVIVPDDYVGNLAGFLVENKNAGVVGAISANIQYEPEKGISEIRDIMTGKALSRFKSADIRERFLKVRDTRFIYHMGVNPDYMYAYFSCYAYVFNILFFLLGFIGVRAAYSPIIHFDRRYLKLIYNGAGSYKVSTVAGCSQVFRRKLVDEIGRYDDDFNPYGFEDADFCIRAMERGYSNYIDANTWIYHGTNPGKTVSDPRAVGKMIFKGLTVLSYKIFSNPARAERVIRKLILCKTLFTRPYSLGRFRGRIEGFRDGREIRLLRETSNAGET